MSQIEQGAASAVELPPSDSRGTILLGLAALVLGLGGFLAWAALAPLDEGVPVAGVVAVETYRKVVQHPDGGVAQDIRVREGDKVVAGQPLLVLDTAVQRGHLAVIADQLAGLQAQLAGLHGRSPQREKQLDSMRRQAASLEPLVDEELYPRNQYAELQRQISGLQAEVIADRAAQASTQAQIAELLEKRQILQTEIDRAVIAAPVAGTVFGLAIHTVGGVIPAGGRILELVPEGDALVITAQVPTHLIEMVRAGLPARLRFVALNPRRTPEIDGTVALVGADRVTDEASRQSYYTAKISVPAEAMRSLGGAAVVTPGMPVDIIIVTGERTFLDYLIKPLQDSFAGGLKER